MTTTTADQADAGPSDTTKPDPRPEHFAELRGRALPIAAWTGLLIFCYWLSELAESVSIPAPELLVPLIVGAVLALAGIVRKPFPKPASKASHALVGVVMGSYLDPSSLTAVASSALPLTVITVLTVAIAVGAAALLARTGKTSLTNAILGVMPGGSAAIIACADDLGADSRQVAFTQYLRVGLVALSAPLLATLVGAGADNDGTGGIDIPTLDHLVVNPNGIGRIVILVGVCVLGVNLGRRLRLPSPGLLGPMILATFVTFTFTSSGFAPDGPLRDVMFAVVGLEVGLRFTRASVKHVGTLVPAITACTLAVCAACAGLAWLLAAMMGIPFVEAYLATTPGGINAVLATAASTNTNVPLVSTVQSLRLFVVVLAAPPIIRWLARQQAKNDPPIPGPREEQRKNLEPSGV
jgi:hypothetical protein